jgi:hypothetical protein
MLICISNRSIQPGERNRVLRSTSLSTAVRLSWLATLRHTNVLVFYQTSRRSLLLCSPALWREVPGYSTGLEVAYTDENSLPFPIYLQVNSLICQDDGRFEVLTAVLLKTQIFWDVIPCRLVNTVHDKFFSHYLTVTMKALRTFETSVTKST